MNYKSYSKVTGIIAVFLIASVTICFGTSNSIAEGNRLSTSLPERFDDEYIKELENGHHTEDLNPESVFVNYLRVLSLDENDFSTFELIEDRPDEKMYVSTKKQISVRIVAYEVTTSKEDKIIVWIAQPYVYYDF